MRTMKKLLLTALVVAPALFAGQSAIPASNNAKESSIKLTTYWTVDTSKVFAVNIHLNSVTLFQFPGRVKFVAVGNTAEISTTVDNQCIYVKPLLGKTHSNMIVTLYSGEILTINLTTETHDNMSERVVFFYPDHNPARELAEKLKASYELKETEALNNQKDELLRSIPEQSVKELVLYRISNSRKSTTLKHLGYLISFDGIVSTKAYTYFLFSTNAQKNTECPVMTVSKIEIKTASRDKSPVEIEEFMNTADRIIVRTPIIAEKPEKTKLFMHFKIYEETKIMKVTVF